MTAPLTLERLARRLSNIEKMVERRTPQLASSSIENGAVEAYDASGQLTQLIGKQYDGTYGAAPVAGPVPPTPVGLTMTPAPNGVMLEWQGAWDGGPLAVAPLDLAHVEVHLSTDPAFTGLFFATKVGEIVSARGGFLEATSPPGVPVYGRLVARTTAGKASAPSKTVGPVSAAKIPAELLEIDYSALVGTTIWYNDESDPPTVATGAHAGDLWLRAPDGVALRAEADGDEVVWVESRDQGIAAALQEAQDALAAADAANIASALAQAQADAASTAATDATAAASAAQTTATDADTAAGNAQTTATNAATAASTAQTAADNAYTLADGKTRAWVQSTTPTAPTGGFKTSDLWIDTTLVTLNDGTTAPGNITKSWDGSAWQIRKITGASITPKSVIASDVIATGTITGALIEATAINGKTITGATVQTAGSGARIVLDLNGLRGFDVTNTLMTSISNATGVLTAKGATLSGGFKTAETGARMEVLQDSALGKVRSYSGKTWTQASVPGAITVPAEIPSELVSASNFDPTGGGSGTHDGKRWVLDLGGRSYQTGAGFVLDQGPQLSLDWLPSTSAASSDLKSMITLWRVNLTDIYGRLSVEGTIRSGRANSSTTTDYTELGPGTLSAYTSAGVAKTLAMANGITPGALQTTTIGAGWQAASPAPQCWKTVEGEIHLRGWIQNQGTFTPAGGEVLCTLPVGFRPTQATFIEVPVSVGQTMIQLNVATTGVVSIARPHTSAIGALAVWSFDSRFFRP